MAIDIIKSYLWLHFSWWDYFQLTLIYLLNIISSLFLLNKEEKIFLSLVPFGSGHMDIAGTIKINKEID